MYLHVDMDAFFAAIEERENRHLCGKPVVISGPLTPRSVVSTANYEARKYGIHSAMPTLRAKQICPHAIFLPPRLGFYHHITTQLNEIFLRYTPLVEFLSADEAFLDVGKTAHLFGGPLAVAHSIQQTIENELNLPASVGGAPVKYVAKIASDWDKPKGLVLVKQEDLLDFLSPLPLKKIWGVGPKTVLRLKRLGLNTVLDIRQRSLTFLTKHLGQLGNHLWNMAHGIDGRSVADPNEFSRERKQISAERTFEKSLTSTQAVTSIIRQLAERLTYRLRKKSATIRQVTLKLRFNDFRTITRNKTLKEPTDHCQVIDLVAQQLLQSYFSKKPFQPVRLIGLGVQDLSSDRLRQMSLFGEHDFAKQSKVEKTKESIRNLYGPTSISSGYIKGPKAGMS
ncbi:MAG: DNA polymerase IV [Pirellulaceae bacterium]|nr:DNA polymerase IV [Pirellulaceae bacterium]